MTDMYGEIIRDRIGSDAEKVYLQARALRREARQAGLGEPALEVVLPRRWDYEGRKEIGTMLRMPVRFGDVDTPIVQFASERAEPEIVGDLRSKIDDLTESRDRNLTLLGQRTNALGRTAELRVALTEALHRVLEVADVERGLVEATKVHDAMGSDVIAWLLDPSQPRPEMADDDCGPDRDDEAWPGQDPLPTSWVDWQHLGCISEDSAGFGKLLDDTLDREEAAAKARKAWFNEIIDTATQPLRISYPKRDYAGRHRPEIVGVTAPAERPDPAPHLYWYRRRDGYTPTHYVFDETHEWRDGSYAKTWLDDCDAGWDSTGFGTHVRLAADLSDPYIEAINYMTRQTAAYAIDVTVPTPFASFTAGGEPGPVKVDWGIALPPTKREREMAEELMRYLSGGSE